MDLQGMRQDVDTFVDTLKKMDNLPDEEEEEEEEESIGSKIDFGGTKSKMVGLSDQFERVKQSLKKTHISLIGMAGIGKTALVAQAILAELDPTNYFKFTEGDERIVEVVRFLNEEESVNLLCEKVFGKRDFPSQLEKAAKKIAKKCEGLPLMIVTVASYLSNAEKTPEYWTEVAEKKISVFVDASTDISKLFFPSYEYLPQYLKVLFLYIGAFPQEYEISISELINLLTVEGFLEVSLFRHCMNEIGIWRQLVITSQTSACWFMKFSYPVKTCHLHSS